MEVQYPPGYGIVVYHHSISGVDHALSTSHGVQNASLTAGDAAILLNTMFIDGLLNNGTRIANSGTYLGLTFFFKLPNGDVFIAEQSASIAGTQGSPACPPQCALLVDKRTGLMGRRFRGRFFFPSCYLIEGEVSDAGIITSGVVAGHNATLVEWLDDLTAAGLPMQLFHQEDSETGLPPDPGPTPVTQLTASAKIGTQRNRLR